MLCVGGVYRECHYLMSSFHTFVYSIFVVQFCFHQVSQKVRIASSNALVSVLSLAVVHSFSILFLVVVPVEALPPLIFVVYSVSLSEFIRLFMNFITLFVAGDSQILVTGHLLDPLIWICMYGSP